MFRWRPRPTVNNCSSSCPLVPITRLRNDLAACTVVQAVVKVNSQSNGKGQILTPLGLRNP